PSGRSDLTCGRGKPPLARKPPSADPVPIDPDRSRAASTSRLPAVDAPRRGDYKRRVGGEALAAARFLRYRAARRRVGQPAARRTSTAMTNTPSPREAGPTRDQST